MSTHDEQRMAALTSSLINAGIGSTYHRRSLTEVDPALHEWAVRDAVTAVQEGRGLTLVGTDKAYDGAVLLARAIHLQGLSSLVVPLRRLVKWCEHETPEAETAANVRALFITGFNQEGDSPMLHWQRDDVEELLLDRLDNGRAIFAQGPRGVVRGSWWTDTLVRRIARLNSVMEIKG